MSCQYSQSCEDEYEKLLEQRSRRYDSAQERLRLYRKALSLALGGDKEKIKQILSKVGF